MTKLSLKRLMRRFSIRTSSIRNPSSPVSSGLVRRPPLRGEPAEVVDQRPEVVVPPRDAEHMGAWGRKKRVLRARGPRVTRRLGYQHGVFGVRADDSNCLQNKRWRKRTPEQGEKNNQKHQTLKDVIILMNKKEMLEHVMHEHRICGFGTFATIF